MISSCTRGRAGSGAAQLVRLMARSPTARCGGGAGADCRGASQEEVLKFCDIHTAASRGHRPEAARPPPRPPVHTSRRRTALEWEIAALRTLYDDLEKLEEGVDPAGSWPGPAACHALLDVEKHYRRKENLLFPSWRSTGSPAAG